MKPVNRKARNQGMNWIRPEKRLAIYLRDSLSCCYCNHGVEDSVRLTLDHVIPHSKGGDNSERNLVTACLECNSARGNKPVTRFAPRRVCQVILVRTNTPIDVPAAKKLIARRGGFTAALAA